MAGPCDSLDFFECHISVILWKTFSPTFILIGLVGNALAVVVLSRRRMCGTTTSVYLRLLAVVDSIVLLISVLRSLIINYFNFDLRDLDDSTCKVQSWLYYNASGLSCWLLCAIAIDRLVAIKYPLWAKTHCSKVSALVVGTVLTAIILLLNSHMLWILNVQEDFVHSNTTNATIVLQVTCTTSSQFAIFWFKVWPVCVLILYGITPIICLAVCNILLYRKLAKRHRNFPYSGRGNGRKSIRNGDVSITKMLIFVCVFFILVIIPFCFYIILSPYLFDRTPHNIARQLLFWTITASFLYCNNTFNFFIYCLSGRLFRRELIAMFRQIKLQLFNNMSRGHLSASASVPVCKPLSTIAYGSRCEQT